MTYSKSPRSNGRVLKKIELPEELKVFFGKRRKFIRGIPSYDEIEGNFPEDHSHNFDTTYGFPIPLRETYPVNNQTEEAYKKAQEKTTELLHIFFGVSENRLTAPVREYMLTGGTKPIRVSTELDGQGRRVFVKLPSLERIIGLSLYNLITENAPLDFLFSEYVFVEDSVKGRHIDEEHIKYFQMLDSLGESVVRLAVQDRFLGLNDLDREVQLPERKGTLVNIIVNPKGKAVAFDVDCTFKHPFPPYDLVEVARQAGIKIPKDFEREVIKDEARRISHVICGRSRKAYQKFVSLIDHLRPLVDQFKTMGLKSGKEYFQKKEDWLKKTGSN